MKQNKLLIILPLIASLISCTPNKEVTINSKLKTKIIDALIDNVHVKASASQKLVYPAEYSYLNSSNYYSCEMDYSLIKNEDGTNTAAVRDYSSGEILTYYQGKDGKAMYEVFTTDNKVTTTPVIANNSYVTYSEYFSNPFSFIDRSEIDNELNLFLDKANFVVSYYLGLKVSCEEAKFVLDPKNERATSLDIKVSDVTTALLLSNTKVIEGTLSTEISIDFSYDIAPITHLVANETSDENIANALRSIPNNYTIYLRSDSLANDVALYYTGDYLYLHYDIESRGVSDGDVLYKKNGSKYNVYNYVETQGKFIAKGSVNDVTNLLPKFDKIIPDLFTKRSDTVYTLDFASAKLNAELLLLSQFNYYTSNYRLATVTLNNNQISTITLTVDSASPVILTENIFNQGTTTLPSWLDISSL